MKAEMFQFVKIKIFTVDQTNQNMFVQIRNVEGNTFVI